MDSDDEETREEFPAKKNVIKRRTLQTRRNPRTLAKEKRIRKEKEFVKQAHLPL